MDQNPYPFADIDLARRLERTEARSNADFVEARSRAFPDRGAAWIDVAGAYAMFDGVGSPLTQTFGLGLFQEISAADMDALEEFFSSRGADILHEVSPIADKSVFALLSERGYRPVEFSSVLYRPIDPDLRLSASPNDAVKVRLIEESEFDLFAATASEGWSESPEIADFLAELAQVTAQSKSLSFIAELDGKSIATGALSIAGDVALLAGASTIPSARRQIPAAARNATRSETASGSLTHARSGN